MKTIFEITACLLLALLCLPLARAEDAPKPGFVRLANALVQGTGPLAVEIDGVRLNSKGYRPGDLTGGIRVEPGMRTFRFSRDGVVPGSTRLKVSSNKTAILIPFAERVQATDEKPAHWAIRILRLKQQRPEKGRGARFVSVCQKPEIRVDMRSPDGDWAPVFVKRLAVSRVPILYARGYVPLRCSGRKLDSIPVATKGDYIVLLYDGEAGELRSLNFKDRIYRSTD